MANNWISLKKLATANKLAQESASSVRIAKMRNDGVNVLIANI